MTIAKPIRFLIFLAALALSDASLIFLAQPSVLQAQTREEVVLWESIKDSERVSDFRGYLDKYPKGTFATIARRRIEELQRGTTRSFVVFHFHPGFGRSTVQGVLRLTSGRIKFSESGASSNPDDDFDVTCSEVLDLNENGSGSDKHQIMFHVKLTNKNYNFFIDRGDYKPLRDLFSTDTCAR